MSDIDHEVLARVADRLAQARRVLFITGAGLSADSGLPTYRGIGGLYRGGLTEEGLPIEEILSGAMLQREPALTWKYLHQIGHATAGARPNRGHEVLAALEQRLPEAWLLTQNVDGFHRDAGSRQLIEIHGNLRELQCMDCRRLETVPDLDAVEPLPMCRHCMGLLRPRVVLFGEQLPRREVLVLEGQLSQGFDLVLSIGTSSLFPYIAWPVIQAREAGVPSVEINPGESEVSAIVGERLRSPAAATLEALWERLEGL